jgi:hypothetical protein
MQKMRIVGILALVSLGLFIQPVSAKVDVRTSPGYEQTQQSNFDPLHPYSLADIARGDILEFGHSGPAVEIIRSLLLEMDYPVEASGELYDREVAFQIGRFQRDHQLAEPESEHWGRVGPATLRALQEQAALGRYNSSLGQQLAEYARSRVSGTRRYCYNYVARAIHAYLHPFLTGLHAYMAAPQLASSGFFKEVKVSSDALPHLPVGAVVVWDKGTSRSGHISIADGKGNEISDHVSPQMLAHYGGAGHRVFLPIAR